VAKDLDGAPESWEVADLEESMTRLILSSKKDSSRPTHGAADDTDASSTSCLSSSNSSLAVSTCPDEKVSEDVLNQVDQFLREALQNPRERLSSELCKYVYIYNSRYIYLYSVCDMICMCL
jgi:hypothetical protein